uniref:Uncharacterized protein n=1 Tax=Octopus bimaculoides TaxID=37653 RepID=A0A0L8H3I5_OCTBM
MRVQLIGYDAERTVLKQMLDLGNDTSVVEKDGRCTDHNWLKSRAILDPKNVAVDHLNFKLLEQFPGERQIYNSIDAVLNIYEAANYPDEFLNIMLLRNLNPPKLFNGTRLIMKKIIPTVLETTILTGKASGEPVFIPRIPLIPSDMPFQYKRLQFPLKLSFEMRIKKAQGQFLNVVGLNIAEPVFTHGQLYVGCSSVSYRNHLFIYVLQALKT